MCRATVKFFLLLALVSGCASQPDTRSARHIEAMESAAKGEQAYFAGRLEQARRHYEQALRLNTGIENSDGIAWNLLSLAQIHAALGEHEQAEARLREISDNGNRLFASPVRAEAAARRAQLALRLKQPERADELAGQAQRLCAETGCAIGAAIANLQARAALMQGRLQASADIARDAESIAEKAKQDAELANAHRLQGEVRTRLGAPAEALPLLESALALDKRLGMPDKIAEDLELLAEAAALLGRHDEARAWRARAEAVRISSGKTAP